MFGQNRDLVEQRCPAKNLSLCNPHSLVQAAGDPLFQQALHDADLVTPDGTGIVLASKMLGGAIHERITGSDIFWGLSDRLNEAGGKSYFFLGASEETLAKIKTKLATDYPEIVDC